MKLPFYKVRTKSSSVPVSADELKERELVFYDNNKTLHTKTLFNKLVTYMPVDDDLTSDYTLWTSNKIYSYIASLVDGHQPLNVMSVMDGDQFVLVDGSIRTKDGSISIELLDIGTGPSQINTDNIPEGLENKYYDDSYVRHAITCNNSSTITMTIDRNSGIIEGHANLDNVTIGVNDANKLYIKAIDGGVF